MATSASDTGISGILIQEIPVSGDPTPINGEPVEKIVAFLSRAYHDTEARYTDMEKQCLEVVYAIQKFRPYLYSRKFTLITSTPCIT